MKTAFKLADKQERAMTTCLSNNEIENTPEMMGETMGEEMSAVNRKRILYVDDEKSLAMLGADLLEDYGYQVTCAYDGDEALTLFGQGAEVFDVVVTDESMPGMTGIQLSQELYRRSPDVPVILCSGHMLTMQEVGMDQTNIKAVLAKTDVCMKLPEILDELFSASR